MKDQGSNNINKQVQQLSLKGVMHPHSSQTNLQTILGNAQLNTLAQQQQALTIPHATNHGNVSRARNPDKELISSNQNNQINILPEMINSVNKTGTAGAPMLAKGSPTSCSKINLAMGHFRQAATLETSHQNQQRASGSNYVLANSSQKMDKSPHQWKHFKQNAQYQCISSTSIDPLNTQVSQNQKIQPPTPTLPATSSELKSTSILKNNNINSVSRKNIQEFGSSNYQKGLEQSDKELSLLRRRSDILNSIDKKHNSNILPDTQRHRLKQVPSPRVLQQVVNNNVQVGSHRLDFDSANRVPDLLMDQNKQSTISNQNNSILKHHHIQKYNTNNVSQSYATSTTTNPNVTPSDPQRKPKSKINSQSIVLNSSTINQLRDKPAPEPISAMATVTPGSGATSSQITQGQQLAGKVSAVSRMEQQSPRVGVTGNGVLSYSRNQSKMFLSQENTRKSEGRNEEYSSGSGALKGVRIQQQYNPSQLSARDDGINGRNSAIKRAIPGFKKGIQGIGETSCEKIQPNSGNSESQMSLIRNKEGIKQQNTFYIRLSDITQQLAQKYPAAGAQMAQDDSYNSNQQALCKSPKIHKGHSKSTNAKIIQNQQSVTSQVNGCNNVSIMRNLQKQNNMASIVQMNWQQSGLSSVPQKQCQVQKGSSVNSLVALRNRNSERVTVSEIPSNILIQSQNTQVQLPVGVNVSEISQSMREQHTKQYEQSLENSIDRQKVLQNQSKQIQDPQSNDNSITSQNPLHLLSSKHPKQLRNFTKYQKSSLHTKDSSLGQQQQSYKTTEPQEKTSQITNSLKNNQSGINTAIEEEKKRWRRNQHEGYGRSLSKRVLGEFTSKQAKEEDTNTESQQKIKGSQNQFDPTDLFTNFAYKSKNNLQQPLEHYNTNDGTVTGQIQAVSNPSSPSPPNFPTIDPNTFSPLPNASGNTHQTAQKPSTKNATEASGGTSATTTTTTITNGGNGQQIGGSIGDAIKLSGSQQATTPRHRRNSQSQSECLIQQQQFLQQKQQNQLHQNVAHLILNSKNDQLTAQNGQTAINYQKTSQNVLKSGMMVMPDLQNISTIPNLPNIGNIDLTAGQNLYQQFLKNQQKEKLRNGYTLGKDKNGHTIIIQNSQLHQGTVPQASKDQHFINNAYGVLSTNSVLPHHRASSSTKIPPSKSTGPQAHPAPCCDSMPRGAGFFTGPVSPLKQLMLKNESSSVGKFCGSQSSACGVQSILLVKHPSNQGDRVLIERFLKGGQNSFRKMTENQGDKKSTGAKLGPNNVVDQVNIETNVGQMGAVGTQMNLYLQNSQVLSPKNGLKLYEEHDMKYQLKDLSEMQNKNAAKRQQEFGNLQRNKSNQKHTRFPHSEMNGSRNMSPTNSSMIHASHIQANSQLIEQQINRMGSLNLVTQTNAANNQINANQTNQNTSRVQQINQSQLQNSSLNTPGLQFNPETNGIMIQGMSRDRAMKFQRRIIQEQHVQFLLNQKMVQEELERNIIQNYYNLNQNKYHMSISDIQKTLAHQQALQLKHQELQKLVWNHQLLQSNDINFKNILKAAEIAAATSNRVQGAKNGQMSINFQKELQDLQLQHQLLFEGNYSLLHQKQLEKLLTQASSQNTQNNATEASKMALLTKSDRREYKSNLEGTTPIGHGGLSVSPKKQPTFKVRSNGGNSTGKKNNLGIKDPREMPPTKIKIWHEFDNSLHYNHKFNVTVRNINIVVRLIFKNTKDQSAITAMSSGSSANQIQSQIDEKRLNEIQKIASTMKVGIPKRFESKTALREFIQSREFIAAMKLSMSSQLFHVINNANKLLPLITAKLDKQHRMHGGGAIKSTKDQHRGPGGVISASTMSSSPPDLSGAAAPRPAHGLSGSKGGTGGDQKDGRNGSGSGKRAADAALRVASPQKKNGGEGGKAARKRSQVNGSESKDNADGSRPSESRQNGSNKQANGKRAPKSKDDTSASMGKTGSNFNQTKTDGFTDKEKKSSKKKRENKGQNNGGDAAPNGSSAQKNQNSSLKNKKEKEKDKEQNQFEKEVELYIQEEALRREEEEMEPLTKEDKLKIRERFIREKERQLEKEKLLQITQKYYIGLGNNHQVVKNAIKQRYWWTQAASEDFQDANFIWTSWKREKHIDYLKRKGQNSIDVPIKIYGRMNNNKHLANKKGIFINMRDYYQMMGVDPFSILPLTFLIQNSNDSEYKKLEKEYNRIRKLQKQNRQTANRLINEHLAKKKQELISKGLKPSQVQNRRPNYHKMSLYYSDDEHSTEADSFFPEDYEDDEMRAIRDKYPVPLNTWIVKPGENSNRGCGINVVHDLQEVRQLVSSAGGINAVGYQKTFIVQKYIDNPFLIHRRKFDFRVFALVTCINKSIKGYFYEDGYIRTSSKEFDLDNLDDKFIHLTNDAIQKQGEDFGKFENCNKMSYTDFQRYLNQYHADLEIDVLKHIVPQMKKLIVDTIRATCHKLDPMRLTNSFEIFGYDFMIDDQFKLNLIEVNTNPCLETESPLLARIIPELIDNTFKIVLDPIFPSPDLSSNRKLLINELPQEIKYQLIFDEDLEGAALKQKFDSFYDGLDYAAADDEKLIGADGKPLASATGAAPGKRMQRAVGDDDIASDNEDELDEIDREDEDEFEEEDEGCRDE